MRIGKLAGSSIRPCLEVGFELHHRLPSFEGMYGVSTKAFSTLRITVHATEVSQSSAMRRDLVAVAHRMFAIINSTSLCMDCADVPFHVRFRTNRFSRLRLLVQENLTKFVSIVSRAIWLH